MTSREPHAAVHCVSQKYRTMRIHMFIIPIHSPPRREGKEHSKIPFLARGHKYTTTRIQAYAAHKTAVSYPHCHLAEANLIFPVTHLYYCVKRRRLGCRGLALIKRRVRDIEFDVS